MPFTYGIKAAATGVVALTTILGGGAAVDNHYTSKDELSSSQEVQNHLIVGQLLDFRMKYSDDRIEQLTEKVNEMQYKKAFSPASYTDMDKWREESLKRDIELLQMEKKDLQKAKEKAIETFGNKN